MRSLPWLLGTLLVVLGGIWLTTRRGGSAYAEPIAVAPEVPAERRVGEEPPPPPPATVGPRAPELADRYVALHRELDAAFGSPAERRVLERLVDLGLESGDERAYELVLGTLANPASELYGSRSQRDALLGRAWGSRSVQRFAGETVEYSAADPGSFERSDVQSFQVLLATNGLASGLWILVEQLASSDPELAKGAVEALKSARPVDPGLRRELRAALFEELLAPRACAFRYELALALLALDQPTEAPARPRLVEIAFEGAGIDRAAAPPELDRRALALDVRGAALLALADAFDPDTLRRSIEFYERRSIGEDLDAALCDRIPGMWRRLSGPPPDATPEEREAYRARLAPLEQFFLRALGAPGPRTVEHVRRALQGPAFQPLDPALTAALAAAR